MRNPRKQALLVAAIVAVMVVLAILFVPPVLKAFGSAKPKPVPHQSVGETQFDRNIGRYPEVTTASQDKLEYQKSIRELKIQKAKQAAKKAAEAKRKADKLKREASSINRYLAGSPLAGKGEVMIKAGRQYGVDPRAIAAIASKESTKGENCFRPHNAWGMMGRSFPSWDEGIYANARLLAKLGGNIDSSLANKYCPPTASHWLSFVRREMSKM